MTIKISLSGTIDVLGVQHDVSLSINPKVENTIPIPHPTGTLPPPAPTGSVPVEPEPVPEPEPPVEQNPNFTLQSGFGINLAGQADWGRGIVFTDLSLIRRRWVGENWSENPEPNSIHRAIMPSAPGRYEIKWEKGTVTSIFNIEGDVVVSTSVDNVNKRAIVELKADGIWCCSFSEEPGMFSVLPENVENPPRFNQDFLNHVRNFNPKIIRFMDFGQTNNSKETFETRTKLTDRYIREHGVSYEDMISFAKEVGAVPWICVPHTYDEKQMKSLVDLLFDLNPPTLILEHSNEVWNAMFKQNQEVAEQALAAGMTGEVWERARLYHAEKTGILGKIAKEKFGERVKIVVGEQHQIPWWCENVLKFLQEKDLLQYVDALAVAPYFGHNKKVGANTNVENMLQALESDVQEMKQLTEDCFERAKKYNKILVAYEGGQHVLAASNSESDVSVLRAIMDHPKMKDLYIEMYDHWYVMGGGAYIAFSYIVRASQHGHWGVLESIYTDPQESPRYQAYVHANDLMI